MSKFVRIQDTLLRVDEISQVYRTHRVIYVVQRASPNYASTASGMPLVGSNSSFTFDTPEEAQQVLDDVCTLLNEAYN